MRDRTQRKKREKTVLAFFVASSVAMIIPGFFWSLEIGRCMGSAQQYAACYPERLVPIER